MAESKIAKFKMAAIIKLSENEGVWVRLNYVESESDWEWECFWVNLRDDNKVSESKMAVSEFNMAEFQDGCHHQVKSEWMNEVNLSQMAESSLSHIELCLPVIKSEWEWEYFWVRSEIRMSQSFVLNGKNAKMCWIQHGRVQDGCHHQVEWQWMSLSQIELVLFRVRVEWECFWVNLREDNKVSESKMPCVRIQDGKIQDGCHHQVESEWMSEVFFLQMVGTNLGKCEWVWE